MSVRWIESFAAGQKESLYELYRREWWTKDRQFADVMKMVSNSDLTLAAIDQSESVVAFARVLTDYTFKAMVFDVIVAEAYRKTGMGRMLVERILNHERLSSVKSFELYCPDRLVPFYERLGFERGQAAILFREA